MIESIRKEDRNPTFTLLILYTDAYCYSHALPRSLVWQILHRRKPLLLAVEEALSRLIPLTGLAGRTH